MNEISKAEVGGVFVYSDGSLVEGGNIGEGAFIVDGGREGSGV